jgi:hypothetical protein
MISIILSVAVVALIAYNVYSANKVQSELIIKNAIIASLQTQVEALFKAKAELIQQLNAASKEVLPVEKPAIFSKKKASAKPAKV